MHPHSRWEYRNPVNVVFGTGRLRELARHLPGHHPLIVTSPGMTQRGITKRITDLFEPAAATIHDRVRSNPSLDDLDETIRGLRGARIDSIVALGGGSSMDVGKVLSLALVGSGFSARDLVDVRGDWDAVEPIPLIAVPTTAGTGSEVTPFATVWDSDRRRKLSVASARLAPTTALVDPELTLLLPWEATLGPGLDAYSQCFEAIWNRNATPITTAFAERGILLVPDALRKLRTDPSSIGARTQMAEAALFSGLAISHTRTALAHSISYPITAHFGVPHGLACALTLPAVLAFNLEADDGRLAEVAARAGLAGPERLVASIFDLYRELGVAEMIQSRLPDVAMLQPLVPEMLTSERADNNIRPADHEDVAGILAATAAWLDAAQVSR